MSEFLFSSLATGRTRQTGDHAPHPKTDGYQIAILLIVRSIVMTKPQLSSADQQIYNKLMELPCEIHAAEIRVAEAVRAEQEASHHANVVHATVYGDLATNERTHFRALYETVASQTVIDARMSRIEMQHEAAIAEAELNRLQREYDTAVTIAGLFGNVSGTDPRRLAPMVEGAGLPLNCAAVDGSNDSAPGDGIA